MSNRKLVVGAHVIYITPERQTVNALIEVVHTGYRDDVQEAHLRCTLGRMLVDSDRCTADEHFAKYGSWPGVNLVFLQPDEKMTDQHGRQKGHASSCCHGSGQGVPQGYCWLWPDEVPDFVVGETRLFDKK